MARSVAARWSKTIVLKCMVCLELINFLYLLKFLLAQVFGYIRMSDTEAWELLCFWDTNLLQCKDMRRRYIS